MKCGEGMKSFKTLLGGGEWTRTELHCNVFHSLKVFKVFAKANRVMPREGQNNTLKEYSAVHLPMT